MKDRNKCRAKRERDEGKCIRTEKLGKMNGGERSWEKEEWRESIVEGYGKWLEGKNKL